MNSLDDVLRQYSELPTSEQRSFLLQCGVGNDDVALITDGCPSTETYRGTKIFYSYDDDVVDDRHIVFMTWHAKRKGVEYGVTHHNIPSNSKKPQWEDVVKEARGAIDQAVAEDAE